jgi:large conductance mechanosensitive channel
MPLEHPRIREEVEDLVELAEERAKKSMKVLQEFKEFAVKGNVVDMAVGIIIGGAFGTIAKSLVDDIIMPPISVLLHGVDFKQRFTVIKAGANGVREFATIDAAQKAGAVTLNWGNFINNVLTFVIVAFAVFLLVRMINRLRREQQVAPQAPTDKTCDFCATTIPVMAKRCPHCTSELATV